MTWTPNEPAAVFIEPVLNNALAIVRRDYKEALDYYFPTEHYPDFREYAKGMLKGVSLPGFAVGPIDVNTVTAEDNSHIIVSCSFNSYIGVAANNDSDSTDMIMRYTGVLDDVYRKAEKDLCEGISNPFEMYLSSLTHSYGPLGTDRDKTLYFRSSVVETTLNFRQR